MASPAEPPADLAANELQRLGHASGALGKADLWAIQLMCEIGKVILRKAVDELLANVHGGPVQKFEERGWHSDFGRVPHSA